MISRRRISTKRDLFGPGATDKEVVRLLKRRGEPITLIGEGGIGKTALALEVCYRLG